MPRMLLLIASAAFLLSGPTPQAGDWPGFRGPQGTGISAESGFPIAWSPEMNVKWRTPLPGPGNGSPIVVGNRVFVLCAEEEGKQRSTFCFDRETGEQLWKETVRFSAVEETHKTNPYCPSTPVSDGERVAVWHRSAGMHCYDLDGKTLWSRDLGTFEHIWGGGSSPIIYRDMVIQLCGPGERTFLVALDKTTGETRWQTPNEPGGSRSNQGRYVGSWSTPVMISVDGQDQLLCPLHSRVAAYDPLTGEELWMIDGLSSERSDLAYASPMVGAEHALVVGGFGGPALGFKLGGSGDMTASNRLWRKSEPRNPQRIGSGVLMGDNVFLANADGAGSFECLDINTGEQRWVEQRTSDGPHWGSVVSADGKLYVTGQKGITRVLSANPESYEVLAENDLGEQSHSTPALSDGEIFLRTWEALYCIAED